MLGYQEKYNYANYTICAVSYAPDQCCLVQIPPISSNFQELFTFNGNKHKYGENTVITLILLFS